MGNAKTATGWLALVQMDVFVVIPAHRRRAGVDTVLEIEVAVARPRVPENELLAIVHVNGCARGGGFECDLQIEPLVVDAGGDPLSVQLVEVAAVDLQVNGPTAGGAGVDLENGDVV